MDDPETTFIRMSLLDWENLKQEIAQLRERIERLECALEPECTDETHEPTL